VAWEEHGTLSIEIVDTYRKSISPDNPYAPPGRTVYVYEGMSANLDRAWRDAHGVCDVLNEAEEEGIDPYRIIRKVLWKESKPLGAYT
jgi:hypothetical protein